MIYYIITTIGTKLCSLTLIIWLFVSNINLKPYGLIKFTKILLYAFRKKKTLVTLQ